MAGELCSNPQRLVACSGLPRELSFLGSRLRSYPKHRQFLLHASELRGSSLDRIGRQLVANAGRIINVLADKNLVRIGRLAKEAREGITDLDRKKTPSWPLSFG